MKPTLLILAAGMGSRYGGLKQLDPVGPSGETLLEYSVFDAIRAGFGRVVFVVRKAFHKQFKDEIAARFAKHIQIDFVFQELDILPKGFQLPANRQKPWGTGHAVWVARNSVQEPFAVINADDFYGPAAYRAIGNLFSGQRASWPPQFYLVSYALADTLSPHGTVSRGICSLDSEGFLETVVERTALQADAAGPYYEDSGERVGLAPTTPVSMNFFGFTPDLFDFLESQLEGFLQDSLQNPKAEFYLPQAVATMIVRKQAKVRVLPSGERWMGVTYAEDRPQVQQALLQRVERGEYPVSLWAEG